MGDGREGGAEAAAADEEVRGGLDTSLGPVADVEHRQHVHRDNAEDDSHAHLPHSHSSFFYLKL